MRTHRLIHDINKLVLDWYFRFQIFIRKLDKSLCTSLIIRKKPIVMIDIHKNMIRYQIDHRLYVNKYVSYTTFLQITRVSLINEKYNVEILFNLMSTLKNCLISTYLLWFSAQVHEKNLEIYAVRTFKNCIINSISHKITFLTLHDIFCAKLQNRHILFIKTHYYQISEKNPSINLLNFLLPFHQKGATLFTVREFVLNSHGHHSKIFLSLEEQSA